MKSAGAFNGLSDRADQIDITHHAGVVHLSLTPWRHYPSHTLPRCLLLAVVRSQVSPPPSMLRPLKTRLVTFLIQPRREPFGTLPRPQTKVQAMVSRV